mgnify:CR=1 FL=1
MSTLSAPAPGAPTPLTPSEQNQDENRTMSTTPSTATTAAQRLADGEPYIVAFGGQATPWRAVLADLVITKIGRASCRERV